MRFTPSAASAILDVMRKRNLDPKKVVFQIWVQESGAICISFDRERSGMAYEYDGLTVMIDPRIDMSKTTIDFGEVNGRKGIIFLEESHV